MAARAWCRVDLAGGTLDIWPLGVLQPGASTVNVAIGLAARVTVRPRSRVFRVRQGSGLVEGRTPADLASHPEGRLVGTVAEALDLPPVEVAITTESPRGGGLGASSAVTVALIAAAETLLGRPPSPPARSATLARDLEARMMGLPTGTQDHWAALLGGALAIAHRPGGEEVRRLDADLDGLGRHLLVVFSGQSHLSAASNWLMVRRRLDGDPESAALLRGIAEVAAQVPEALEGRDYEKLGGLMRQEWSLRRHLAEEITTPAVESLLRLADSVGAWGGKVCGAGGGGCVAVLGPAEKRETIARALAEAGGQVLAARPTGEPLAVEWIR